MSDVIVYGDVGGYDNNALAFLKALPEKGKKCSVRVNSYGGDAFEGLTMASLLRSREATVFVDGIAASAATPLLCTAKKVVMARGSMLMLHNPWSVAIGDSEEMKHTASVLEKIEESYASLYAEKTGKSVEDMREMMKLESWLTAEEAVALGIADEIDNGLEIAASAPKTAFLARREQTMDLFNKERVAALEAQNEQHIQRVAALEELSAKLTEERDAAASRLVSEMETLVQAHRAEVEKVRAESIEEGKRLATGAILKANAPETTELAPDDEAAPVTSHSAEWERLKASGDRKAADAYFSAHELAIHRGK
jgi:ATP-dependent protease ClpP protease subunit